MRLRSAIAGVFFWWLGALPRRPSTLALLKHGFFGPPRCKVKTNRRRTPTPQTPLCVTTYALSPSAAPFPQPITALPTTPERRREALAVGRILSCACMYVLCAVSMSKLVMTFPGRPAFPRFSKRADPAAALISVSPQFPFAAGLENTTPRRPQMRRSERPIPILRQVDPNQNNRQVSLCCRLLLS
jgi:hypothetical protein